MFYEKIPFQVFYTKFHVQCVSCTFFVNVCDIYSFLSESCFCTKFLSSVVLIDLEKTTRKTHTVALNPSSCFRRPIPHFSQTLSLSLSLSTSPPTHAPQLASITQHANHRMSLWMIPWQLYSSSDWSADGLYGGHFSPERNFTSPSPRPTMWSIL